MNIVFIIVMHALILALIRVSDGYAITNSAQQKLILDIHNTVRSLSATGKMSKYGFGTATKMYPLTWDNALASTAERLAATCIFEHDTFNKGYGQNIAKGGGGNNDNPGIGVPNKQPQGTSRCSNCFSSDEEAIEFLAYAWISGPTEQEEGPYGLNHFTQMVDDDTFRIGCALNNKCYGKVGPSYYLVCNYDPAGNMRGTAAYDKGSTGSKCSAGKRSDGLCSGSSGSSSGGGDKYCSSGIKSENVCCSSICGKCGGTGCGSRLGGSHSCCRGKITSDANYCHQNQPPCRMY